MISVRRWEDAIIATPAPSYDANRNKSRRKKQRNHIQIRSLSGFYNKLIQSPIFLGARCYAVATSPSWGRGHCAHSSPTDITIESYGENLAVELRKRPVSSWVWGFLLSNLITVQKSPVFLLNGCWKLLKMFSRVHIDAELAGGVKQACFSMPTSGCFNFNYLTNMSWDGLKPPTSSFVGWDLFSYIVLLSWEVLDHGCL